MEKQWYLRPNVRYVSQKSGKAGYRVGNQECNWELILEYYPLSSETLKANSLETPIFSWMTPSFSSETQSFSSETPSSSLENTDLNFRPQAYDRRLTKCFIGDPQNFYQRPLGCHQRHQIFIITPQLFIGGAIIGDPNLFIGDSKIFIGDPNIFI